MEVQITPAILTADYEKAKELALKYIDLGAEQIDIDIAEESFGIPTITLEEAVTLITEISKDNQLPPLFWGLDIAIQNVNLRVSDAVSDLLAALAQPRIAVSTKCQIDYEQFLQLPTYKALVIEADTNITMQYPWSELEEVQIMTVNKRQQGAEFMPKLLEKAIKLRDKGFVGCVSIDGGINLTTANQIKDYLAEGAINRLSVGSYFQNSNDLENSLHKLMLALAL